MKTKNLFLRTLILSIIFIFSSCSDDGLLVNDVNDLNSEIAEKGGKPVGGETAGNNLSFPVIWADGVTKVVPGSMEQYSLAGEWWGVWGEDPIDPQADIFSCGPYLTSDAVPCEDALFRAYIQKDSRNVWQAYNWTPTDTTFVDLIDWGDNLESVDWKITSQVRVEMVLLENLAEPVTQFAMRHVSGWGTDEVHGLQTESSESIIPVFGPGTQATVYSDNARFTIQKLNVDDKMDERLNSLEWEPTIGWVERGENPEGIINDPVINTKAGAEINVKGKIIYGFTWKVRNTNDGEGYYRLTFSLDPNDNLKTSLVGTNFVAPVIEPTVVAEAEEEGGGGDPVIDWENNLTYIDILITGKTTGKGGGSGTGGGNGGGSGTGGGSGSGGSGGGSGNH